MLQSLQITPHVAVKTLHNIDSNLTSNLFFFTCHCFSSCNLLLHIFNDPQNSILQNNAFCSGHFSQFHFSISQGDLVVWGLMFLYKSLECTFILFLRLMSQFSSFAITNADEELSTNHNNYYQWSCVFCMREIKRIHSSNFFYCTRSHLLTRTYKIGIINQWFLNFIGFKKQKRQSHSIQ